MLILRWAEQQNICFPIRPGILKCRRNEKLDNYPYMQLCSFTHAHKHTYEHISRKHSSQQVQRHWPCARAMAGGKDWGLRCRKRAKKKNINNFNKVNTIKRWERVESMKNKVELNWVELNFVAVTTVVFGVGTSVRWTVMPLLERLFKLYFNVDFDFVCAYVCV